VGAVRHEHRDPVTGASAEAEQCVGQAVHAGLGLAKGHPRVAGDPRRAIAEAQSRASEQVSDVH
jgi:cobalamin biosynthesis protein CbiD